MGWEAGVKTREGLEMFVCSQAYKFGFVSYLDRQTDRQTDRQRLANLPSRKKKKKKERKKKKKERKKKKKKKGGQG